MSGHGEKRLSEILLIEDNVAEATLFRELLSESRTLPANITHVATLTEGLRLLEETCFDAVLLDLGLPESVGLDTLRRCREAAGWTPVLVLSGLEDEETVLQAAEEGAQDYLVKSRLSAAELQRALRYTLERSRMQRDLAGQTEELFASERRFRTIIEQNADGVIIVDRDGMIQFANPAAQWLFKRELDQLIGRPFGFSLTPDDISEMDILHGDSTLTVEMQTVSIEWSGEDAFLASLRNVTDRKRAETALRESEVKYRDLVEQNLDGIYIVQDGYFKFANRQFLNMMGYTRDELLRAKPEALIAPESRLFLEERGRRMRNGETVETQYEFKGLRKDGSRIDLETNVREIVYEGRKAFQGCVRDVSWHRQAERDLRTLSERLESLVDNLPEGVWLLNGERRVVMANDTGVEYLEELCGCSVGEAPAHVGRMDLQEALEPRNDGRSHTVEIEGAGTRQFELKAAEIVGEKTGEGWVVVVRDVTRERETEERIQTQYRLASVGQLAAGIAHDFNNMLTVMMGFAQMLSMRDDVPADARADLGQVLTQGQRAAQLIRQVLDFSRKSPRAVEQMDLGPFLKEAVKLLGQILPETIQLVAEVSPEPHLVVASPTQLQQVLHNLAINARDAMPNDGQLRVGLTNISLKPGDPLPLPEMQPGDWAVWTVSDTGTGMPDEVVKRIFEPFFTTKPPGQGTGLGLSQAYGLIKHQGGEIDVTSKEGAGTTFTIYLPLVTRERAGPAPEDREIPKGRGETVLVVEDEKMVLKIAQRMLETLHYRVLTAADGERGLELFEREEIDLVLTDVVMPKMNGLVLLAKLRERKPELPVVVMTGYSPGSDENPRLLDRATARLDKPLVLDKMAQALRAALDKRG